MYKIVFLLTPYIAISTYWNQRAPIVDETSIVYRGDVCLS